jgi:hypothetical protein
LTNKAPHKVDDQFVFDWLLDRIIGGFAALQDLVGAASFSIDGMTTILDARYDPSNRVPA